jgi:CubicO group peptidase (beta-lactamase class C family)
MVLERIYVEMLRPTAIALLLSAQVLAAQQPQIDALMRQLHDRGQFDGSALVAKDGKVLYRAAFGLADETGRRAFTPETPSCLASLSKPFTATLVLMLSDRNRLHLDDPIGHYLPELPAALGAATLRQVLNHTSGIPDYSSDLNAERPGMSAQDILNLLRKVDRPIFPPGEKYQYSNTGYVLLGLVAEKLYGKALLDVLQERIFSPLGMSHTFGLPPDRPKPVAAANGYDDFGGLSNAGTYLGGDGGLYSTLDDLLKFDQALYTQKLVKRQTLNDAFTPGRVRSGTTTYGLGWNITSGSIWHTGNTAGYRAYMERVPATRLTIILLTNHGNTQRIEISREIQNILAGKPYALPRPSVAVAMYKALLKSGIDAAIAQYRNEAGENELNMLGYQLTSINRMADAIRIFTLNTVEHPTSSNTFDSLAEAYQDSGDKAAAIRNYRIALEKDPGNLHAKTMLEKLQ